MEEPTDPGKLEYNLSGEECCDEPRVWRKRKVILTQTRQTIVQGVTGKDYLQPPQRPSYSAC